MTFDFGTEGFVIAVVTSKTGLSKSVLMVFSCEKSHLIFVLVFTITNFTYLTK